MNQKVAKKIAIKKWPQKKQRCRVAFFRIFFKVARFKFACFKQIHAKKFSSTLR